MLRRAGPVRPGVRRAAVRDPGRAGRAAPARRRPAGRRRVDPQGRRPARGPRGRRRRHRRAQGRAARRRPAGAAGRAAAAACRWSCPARSRPRSGLAAGVALAAALPELRYDCGLATMSLLTGDVTAEPLAAGGRNAAGPGMAVPDAERLARVGIRSRDPWRARMAGGREFLRATLGSGPADEPVDRARHRPRRRAGPVRPARGRARAGLAQRAAGAGAAAAGPSVGDLRLHVRIDERSAGVPRAGPGQGEPAGRSRSSAPRARPRRTSTRR